MSAIEQGTLDYKGWAARRSQPRFTDWLQELSEPAWTQATTHRFTRELADATIDLNAFRRYLVQDYSFIGRFIGLLGAAINNAPTQDAKERLTRFRDSVTGAENTYFQRSFDALAIPNKDRKDPELLPVTRDLHAVMAEAEQTGGYAEIMAVLVVTEWVYLEWATAVGDIRPEEFYFGEWIDLHANDAFRDFVGWLRQELDAQGPDLPPDRVDRVVSLFRRTVKLEKDFFDAAYG